MHYMARWRGMNKDAEGVQREPLLARAYPDLEQDARMAYACACGLEARMRWAERMRRLGVKP